MLHTRYVSTYTYAAKLCPYLSKRLLSCTLPQQAGCTQPRRAALGIHSATVPLAAPMDNEVHADDGPAAKRLKTSAPSEQQSNGQQSKQILGKTTATNSTNQQPPKAGNNNSEQPSQPSRKRKKEDNLTPRRSKIVKDIQWAAKLNDLNKGMETYASAQADGLALPPNIYNTLLYLSAGGDQWEAYARGRPVASVDPAVVPASKEQCMAASAKIWCDMCEQSIPVDHTTYIALARAECIRGQPDQALEWAKTSIATAKFPIQLRLFHPAMVGYCLKGTSAQVMEIDKMISDLNRETLDLSEYEYALLLEVLAQDGTWEQFSGVLMRVQKELNKLSANTLTIIENYFTSEHARDGLQQSAASSCSISTSTSSPYQWSLQRCTVDDQGYCEVAQGSVKRIDLEDAEWNIFAEGIANLATKNEVHDKSDTRNNDFRTYKEWYERNGPYDILIDGANVAFYGQNRANGGFNWGQVMNMVQLVKTMHPDKKFLLVMHNKRIYDKEAKQPAVQAFLKQLRQDKNFYYTPTGSNDDWYWLYATVKAKHQGLLISNDELRDHIFSLLRPKHFLKWKARHIAHYRFAANPPFDQPELIYPPTYTSCVQLLENGAWMFPAEDGTWLCAKPC